MQRYPRQTLENLQAKPYCIRIPKFIFKAFRAHHDGLLNPCRSQLLAIIDHTCDEAIEMPIDVPLEVGGGKRSVAETPTGIQAQRPSPSHRTHRTHDATDQWRDQFRWLGRTEAVFAPRRYLHESAPRVLGESWTSFRSF